MIKTVTVSWFSAGVSSAVATKLMIRNIDVIVYQHIDDMEADSLRFVRDCERWFGKEIVIQQHAKHKTVESVCRAVGFVSSPWGAPCTGVLKKELRHQWESENRFFNEIRCVWGMDCSTHERERASNIVNEQFETSHSFPLIEHGMTKEEAHGYLESEGIKRPHMYDLGYRNNNCIGCVKATGAGYWNKIRQDFPAVFASRATMERDIGGTCINGTYLDELDPAAGREIDMVVPECGAMCERIEAVQARVESEAHKGPNNAVSGGGGADVH